MVNMRERGRQEANNTMRLVGRHSKAFGSMATKRDGVIILGCFSFFFSKTKNGSWCAHLRVGLVTLRWDGTGRQWAGRLSLYQKPPKKYSLHLYSKNIASSEKGAQPALRKEKGIHFSPPSLSGSVSIPQKGKGKRQTSSPSISKKVSSQEGRTGQQNSMPHSLNVWGDISCFL